MIQAGRLCRAILWLATTGMATTGIVPAGGAEPDPTPAADAAIVAAAENAPAIGTEITLAFAPPLGRRLRYEITQIRTDEPSGQSAAGAAGPSKPHRFTIVREVGFAPTADGYRMTTQLVETFTDAPGAGGESYRAAMAALSGVAVNYRLDRSGHILKVENVDDLWSRLPATRDAQLAVAAGDRNRQTLIARVFDGLIAVPPPLREQMLREDAQRLLAFTGATVKPGDPVTERTERSSPLGGTIPVTTLSQWLPIETDTVHFRTVTQSGGAELRHRIVDMARTLAGTADPAAHAKLERDLAGMTALAFEETADFGISRHWGVLVSARTTRKVMGANGVLNVEEIRRFGDWVS